jgi:hypothetical protein
VEEEEDEEEYNIAVLIIVLQFPTVFNAATCCTGLKPRSNRLYHTA